MKTRKEYRVFAKVGGYENCAGFGATPAEAIANFKTIALGEILNRIVSNHIEDFERERLGEKRIFQTTPQALGKSLDWHKNAFMENSEFFYDVFDQWYDEEREEWQTRHRETWCPKYEIKL